MPEAGVMAMGGATTVRPKSEVPRHSVQRGPSTDPHSAQPAIALITTGRHTGCPLVAGETRVRIFDSVHCDDEHGPSFAEAVESFAHLPGIGAIAACLDHVDDGRMLMTAAASAADQGVPLIALATGSDRFTEAAMRQAGVIRVDGFDQLLDCAQFLARFPRPAESPGPIRIAADSAGAAAHLSDLALRAGLTIDNAESCHDVAEFAARPGAGMLVYAVTEAGPSAERTVSALAAAGRTSTIPIFVICCSSGGHETGYPTVLRDSPDVVPFRTLTNAIVAARAYYDHCDFRVRDPSPVEDFGMAGMKAQRILLSPAPGASSRDQPAEPTDPSEWRTHQLLRAYGIRTPREQLVPSAIRAVRAAATVGYPVLMKASVPGVPSSSAAGLTRNGVDSANQVRVAFRELMDSAAEAGHDVPDGVLVSQQIEGGVDTMVGIRRDPRFGQVVVAGVGGAYAETLGDVAMRVAPFDAHEARRMLDELHCLPLLTSADADIDALASTVLRVQRMAVDLRDVLESFDIAQLRVLPRGHGTVALDASAVLKAR